MIAVDYAERWATNDEVVAAQRERFLGRLEPGALVADVGCGPGRDAAKLSEAGCTVLAIDISLPMLLKARKRFEGALVAADMRRLPLRKKSLAGIWACASFLHIPKRDGASTLQHLRSFLKEDGVLALAVKEGDGEEFRTRAGHTRFFAFYREDELAELVTSAGFSIVEAWTEKDDVHPDPWLNVIATAS